MDKMQRVSDECSNSALIDSTAIGDDQGTIQSECGEEENNQVLEAIEQSMKMHQSLGGRGIKRDVDELHSSSSDHEDMEDTKVGLKPGKKTRGRVKIKMEYIDNKLRRYTTFSKRKTGIMKKVRRGLNYNMRFSKCKYCHRRVSGLWYYRLEVS